MSAPFTLAQLLYISNLVREITSKQNSLIKSMRRLNDEMKDLINEIKKLVDAKLNKVNSNLDKNTDSVKSSAWRATLYVVVLIFIIITLFLVGAAYYKLLYSRSWFNSKYNESNLMY